MRTWLAAALVLLSAVPATGDLVLPPGFTAEPYITGHGFDSGSDRGVRGFAAAATLAFDATGHLYLAKVGARFRSGDVEDLSAIYRIPPGGARLSPDNEARYFHGPPLKNPQVGAVRGRGEIYVTTYDRDRKIGALYRMADGRPVLFAGGTPLDGSLPLLRHPEGIVLDTAGRIFVADRDQNAVIRLDATGRVLDREYLALTRPRMLAIDERGQLWIGSDGTAETPFQDGAGQIWRVGPDRSATLVLQGPLPGGIALSPAGFLFVSQRRAARLFAVTPDGKRVDFATSTEGTFVRGLAFAPVTPETRRAGIAGDLFVIVVRRYAWMVNEVMRISGPFDEFVRLQSQAPTP